MHLVFLAQSLGMGHLLLVNCLPAACFPAETVSADSLPAGYLLVVSLSADYLPLVVLAAGTLTADCLPVERVPLLEAPAMKLAVAYSLLLTRHLILGPTQ